jgi:hypothetical protein
VVAKAAPKRKSKGNIFIFLILLTCLVVPAIIYLIWDQCSAQKVCRFCGSPSMVPTG